MIRALLVIIFLASGSAALRAALDGAPATQPDPENAVAVPAVSEPEIATTTVFVASRDIARGQEIMPEDVDWIVMPVSAVRSDFISTDDPNAALQELVGDVAARDLSEGEPLVLGVPEPPPVFSLADRLRPGMRAISVPIETQSMAGGLIMPGDHVDLIHTFFPTGSDTAISMVLATNVRLLALDDVTAFEAGNDAVGEDFADERNATLEVRPDQIGAIAAAEQDGQLGLALRSAEEPSETVALRSPIIRINRGGEISLEIR